MCSYDIPLCVEDMKKLACDFRDGKITFDEFNKILNVNKKFKGVSKVLQSNQMETKKVENEPVFEKIEPDKSEPKTLSEDDLKTTISFTDKELSLIIDGLEIFRGDVNRITTNSSIAQCFTDSLVDNISTLLEKLYSTTKK